jgi:hypothetical protein
MDGLEVVMFMCNIETIPDSGLKSCTYKPAGGVPAWVERWPIYMKIFAKMDSL